MEYGGYVEVEKYTTSQNINKQNVNIADETFTDYTFSVGITIN